MDTITDILSSFFVSKQKQGLPQASKEKSKPTTQSSSSKTSTQSSKSSSRTQNSESSSSSQSSKSKSSIKSSDSRAHTKSSSTISEDKLFGTIKPKRYIIKAHQNFHKKSIMMVNNNNEDNVKMLSDLLHIFTLMTNVRKQYDNKMYIISSDKTKSDYKKIVLEHPYLYFYDIHVSKNLDKSQILEISNADKMSLVVLEVESNSDYKQYMKSLEPIASKCQIIVLVTADLTSRNFGQLNKLVLDTFKDMGSNKVLMYAKEETKILQKQFFKKILKPLCIDVKDMDFESYYDLINHEIHNVKYIFINNDELRYY